MHVNQPWRRRGLLVFAAAFSASPLAGCGGGSHALAPFSPSTVIGAAPTNRALVVGGAAGAAYDALNRQYAISSGTGAEDPGAYDMVVYDGNATSPAALAGNAAIASFLRRGKMVVLLNNTEAHRDAALKGVLWAHAKGASAASAFFVVRDARGTPQREVELDMPVHLQAAMPANCHPGDPCDVAAAIVPPTGAQLAVDAQTWTKRLQLLYASAQSSAGGNISPPVIPTGQTVVNFDDLQPFAFTVDSYLDSMNTGPNGFYNDGSGFWCPSTTLCNMPNDNRPGIGAAADGTFESSLSVALLANGQSGYQHLAILRQYSLVTPEITAWAPAYLAYFSNPSGYDLVRTVYSTLGFNLSNWLRASPPSGMLMTSALPATANNTTQLSTSSSNTQSVGLSATAGYQGGGAGLLSANWSDSWSWTQTSTVNISDWTATQSGNPGPTYVYAATGGTSDTYNTLTTYYQWAYPNSGDNGMTLSPSGLNGLQQGNMVAQSETQWTSPSPLPPQELTFTSSTEPVLGEVFQFQPCDSTLIKDCTPNNYSNTPSAQFSQSLVVDFSTPSLQPPATAPWTLQFGLWPTPVGLYETLTGQVTLNAPAPSATTVLLTYVVEPTNTINTLPLDQACKGNQYSFNPANSVVNNGNPPLSVTIPTGQTSATFSLTFQTGSPYNVQVVSWMPSTVANGQPIINPEAAWCLTVPATGSQSLSSRRV